jgi:hypothetical protein
MAAFDGEGPDAAADHEAHVASCPDCRYWLQDLAAVSLRFTGTVYPENEADLWLAVQGRLRSSEANAPMFTLYAIGALCIGGRLLQLFTDLPLPIVQLIPLAAIVAVLSTVMRNPLAIQTAAPELQKRGL